MYYEIIMCMLIFGAFCIALKFLSQFLNLKKSEIRGAVGEKRLQKQLEKINLESKILTNVYLPKEKEPEQTTEIDAIMVNQKGIFVFECKNYSGWIFGTEKQMNWTQMFNKHQKVSFYNPVKQNNTHIKAIKNILNDKKIQQYYNIVVFASENAELKKIEITSENIHVIKIGYVPKLINEICAAVPDVFTWNEVEQICSTIITNQVTGKDVKKKHIENINKNVLHKR